MTDSNNEKTVYIVEGYEEGLNAIKISDAYEDKKDAEELLKKWTNNYYSPWSVYNIWERKLKLKKDSENSGQTIGSEETEKDLKSIYNELDKIFTNISGLSNRYYLGSKTLIIESLNKIKQSIEMFKSETKDEKEGIYD